MQHKVSSFQGRSPSEGVPEKNVLKGCPCGYVLAWRERIRKDDPLNRYDRDVILWRASLEKASPDLFDFFIKLEYNLKVSFLNKFFSFLIRFSNRPACQSNWSVGRKCKSNKILFLESRNQAC